jgi:hypothetical protein
MNSGFDRKETAGIPTSRQKTSVIARETFYVALCGRNNPLRPHNQEVDYRALTTGDLIFFL